jgi:hypothetical protein
VIPFCFCGAQSLYPCLLAATSVLFLIPLLSRRTRYSWSYGHLIFFIRGYGGAKVCDAESLLSPLFLLYFSLNRFLHSICSLILPLLCRGSMYSLSYGYLNFFRWRSVTQKVLYYLSNVTFSVLWEYVLFELRLFEFFFWRRHVTRKGVRTLWVTAVWKFSMERCDAKDIVGATAIRENS